MSAARRNARLSAALSVLLAVCLERVPIQSGSETLADNRGEGWYGLGVLADILPWSGRGVMEIAGGKGVGKSVSPQLNRIC